MLNLISITNLSTYSVCSFFSLIIGIFLNLSRKIDFPNYYNGICVLFNILKMKSGKMANVSKPVTVKLNSKFSWSEAMNSISADKKKMNEDNNKMFEKQNEIKTVQVPVKDNNGCRKLEMLKKIINSDKIEKKKVDLEEFIDEKELSSLCEMFEQNALFYQKFLLENPLGENLVWYRKLVCSQLFSNRNRAITQDYEKFRNFLYVLLKNKNVTSNIENKQVRLLERVYVAIGQYLKGHKAVGQTGIFLPNARLVVLGDAGIFLNEKALMGHTLIETTISGKRVFITVTSSEFVKMKENNGEYAYIKSKALFPGDKDNNILPQYASGVVYSADGVSKILIDTKRSNFTSMIIGRENISNFNIDDHKHDAKFVPAINNLGGNANHNDFHGQSYSKIFDEDYVLRNGVYVPVSAFPPAIDLDLD